MQMRWTVGQWDDISCTGSKEYFMCKKYANHIFKNLQNSLSYDMLIYCLLLYFIEICLTSCINPQMLPEPRPMRAPVLQTGPMSGVLALSADWSLRSRGLWL